MAGGGKAATDAEKATERQPARPVSTYSIVARDAATGELGVAVQSHWFSVGATVSWAAPGVGAVATQSFVEVSYGPLGLELMRAGKSAPEALAELIAKDEQSAVRQVAMIDARGKVAVHTGGKSIIAFCDKTGNGYSVQANLMEKPTVCDAMARAFESTKGDLAERMMAALEAAQKEGGDIRGKQSAALLVVKGDASLPVWKGREFDLRIEDHKEPIRELRRLLTLARAYRLMQAGDDFMAAGDFDNALKSYAAAEKMAPANHEMMFWHAVTLASTGRIEEALPLFSKAFAMWPPWRELVKRLPASGLLPDDPGLMEKIQAVK